MSAAYHKTVDPAGDLSLSVGTDEKQMSILVSSKVLSLASPVLAAMFGPNFAEGKAILNEGRPVNIGLPDDDPEAMLWICEALHFRQHTTPEISFPLLEKLAGLCDKYDLSLALSPWSDVWLSHFKGSKDGEDHFTKMLWISRELGNHRAFWRISKDMMRCYSSDELEKECKRAEKAEQTTLAVVGMSIPVIACVFL